MNKKKHPKHDVKSELAPVIISYRDDRGKRMHGAFYDHYLVRHITQHPTKITMPISQKITYLQEFIKNSTFALGIGDHLGQRQTPDVMTDPTQERGLLFIPGRSHQETDTEREAHEKELIANAIKRGQPVLAICGGARRLWEVFGGKNTTVKDHLYSSMPYILTSGAMGNNKQIHRIKIEPKSILSAGMYGKSPKSIPVMVNSIHWEAPDAEHLQTVLTDSEKDKTQTRLDITARSVLAQDIAVKSRRGDELNSQLDTVEAFEARYGAPIMGVQWHPEAYYLEDHVEAKYHVSLIQYMAKAGDAYRSRCHVLDTFKTISAPRRLWDKRGFFKPKNLLTPIKNEVSELSGFAKLEV